MVYPFWYSLIMSLNDATDAQRGNIWLLPRSFTLRNIQHVLSSPLTSSAYLVTTVRTVVGSVYSVLVTGFAAYFMTKRYLPGRNVIMIFFMIPLFIGGSMITSYIVYMKLGLINNFLIYILPTGYSLVYMVMIRVFIDGLPSSIEESAKLDGAGYLTIFFRLIVPMCAPIVATILLFYAVYHWLDFVTNRTYITDKRLTVLPKLLYDIQIAKDAAKSMAQRVLSGGSIATIDPEEITPNATKYATLVVTTMPILIVYPFFQKYFAKGALMGAIKE